MLEPTRASQVEESKAEPKIDSNSTMEPCTNKKACHCDQRKREKASKKKAEARKKEAFYGNSAFRGDGGYKYYGHSNDGYGYGYGYGHPYQVHNGPYPYLYGRPERYRYDEYVARAPLSYRDGFNHFGNLHFGDTDPYRCYQAFYETPVTSFPQAPPQRQIHPFYTPETVCSIM